MPYSSWYTPGQALSLAVSFASLDLLVNVLGLAWNGNFFTLQSIVHWMDFAHYIFSLNPVDFLAVAILRICLLLGGALGVYFNPKGGAEACAAYANLTFAFVLLIVAF